MTSHRRTDLIVPVSLIAFSLLPATAGLLRTVDLIGGTSMIPSNLRALAQPAPIIVHAVSSFVFCILGALQFHERLRVKRRGLHRKMGYAVASSGLLSAGTGVWMTVAFSFPPELQGPALYATRLALGLAMIALICRAVMTARAGRTTAHRSSMIRAYAIGIGASTQTFLGLSAMLMVGSELTEAYREVTMVGAWAINLLVAELVIRRSFTGSAQAVHS